MIVNQAFVQKFLHGERPLGKRLKPGRGPTRGRRDRPGRPGPPGPPGPFRGSGGPVSGGGWSGGGWSWSAPPPAAGTTRPGRCGCRVLARDQGRRGRGGLAGCRGTPAARRSSCPLCHSCRRTLARPHPLDSSPLSLLPARACTQSRLPRQVRRRLEATLQQHQLTFAGTLQPLANEKAFRSFLRPLLSENWIVYAKPPFGGPHHVLGYLARSPIGWPSPTTGS